MIARTRSIFRNALPGNQFAARPLGCIGHAHAMGGTTPKEKKHHGRGGRLRKATAHLRTKKHHGHGAGGLRKETAHRRTTRKGTTPKEEKHHGGRGGTTPQEEKLQGTTPQEEKYHRG